MQENLRIDTQSINKARGTYNPYFSMYNEAWQEWTNEPNRKDWVYKGLHCHIYRSAAGFLCGYVRVPASSQFYEKVYDCAPLKAHGGLNYAGSAYWKLPGNEPEWWLGFDCSKLQDYIPSRPAVGGVYRNMQYVQEQCEQLVEQILAYEAPEEKAVTFAVVAEQKFIICTGNIADGVTFYGPFTYEDAEVYLEANYMSGMIMADLNPPIKTSGHLPKASSQQYQNGEKVL